MSRLALFFTSSSGLPSLNARSLSFPALFLQRNIGVTRHKKKPGVVFLYACSSRRCQVTRGVGGLFPPEGRLWASLWTCEREGSYCSCGAHNFDALLHWCGNEIFASSFYIERGRCRGAPLSFSLFPFHLSFHFGCVAHRQPCRRRMKRGGEMRRNSRGCCTDVARTLLRGTRE